MAGNAVDSALPSSPLDARRTGRDGLQGICNFCKRRPAANASLLFCGGCKKARYCSAQCQTSDWAGSGTRVAHKDACKELKDHRKLAAARGLAEGRLQTNRPLVLNWLHETPGVWSDVEVLAWKHRNKEQRHFIFVQTFTHPPLRTFHHYPSLDAPAGTPYLTAVPWSDLVQIFGDGFASAFDKMDIDLGSYYTVVLDLSHAGTETWPRPNTITMQYRQTAERMDVKLIEHLLNECTSEAKTFLEKVTAESAFQEHMLAHGGLVVKLWETDSSWRLKLDHRLSENICGCFLGVFREASHLNATLGLFISEDPKAPMQSLVQLAEGQVHSVPEANFEFLRLGINRVVLHGLIGAAHLNDKRGTLLHLKPGSLERVIVRLDDGEQEVAVKFANYSLVNASEFTEFLAESGYHR